MKKLLIILLCMAMLLSVVACGNSAETPAAPDTDVNTDIEDNNTDTDTDNGDETDDGNGDVVDTTVFDESSIVLSFGAFSDVHINGGGIETGKLREALMQLQNKADETDPDGLDAVCVVGDLTNDGRLWEAELFSQVVNSCGVKNALVVVGNHEVYTGSDSLAPLSVFRELLGDKHFESDVDMTMFDKGSRHCVVNGYHFFFVQPESFAEPFPYAEDVVEWLDDSINAIVTENPNQYVFVFTHIPIADTVWGSYGVDEFSTGLKDTLEKYPQVMAFTAHMHRPTFDERMIMQTGFTAIGCGSLRNFILEPGYSDMLEGDWEESLPKDSHIASTGHLVQVDANGNVRITRMAFGHNSTYKEPWVVSYPDSEGSNLTKYTIERKELNTAPTLSGPITAEISAADPLTATISMPAGKDDDFVRNYLVKITDADGNTVFEDNFLSDFYIVTQVREMKKTFSREYTFPAAGEYTVSITAVDSWDATSETVSATVIFG